MSQMGGGQVMVMNVQSKREHGRKAQMGNIAAAKAVADTIRTTLGPRSMLKMIIDAMGGIVITNDGNAILREVDVSHPAAKSMIELSRAQDEEVGDGTTSVIVLTGEVLHCALPFMQKHMHPTVVIRGFTEALKAAVEECAAVSIGVDRADHAAMKQLLTSCVGTKFSDRFSSTVVELAMGAVETVATTKRDGGQEVDIKRYAKVEKIPGGEVEDCRVLKGVMINKDITHPRMRRKIKNPRILLLDCSLEYKKGESQANIEMSREEDWELLLRAEEEWIEKTCNAIIKHKPDLVITEKGVGDLTQHFFVKAGITCLRRLRKTDNNRVARSCGATIVHRVEEIKEADIGTKCGLYEVKKIGDEYFSFIVDCEAPKACTILLRGGSRDVLNEIERNLHDAMNVARNVYVDPRIVPGGGATEMAVSRALLNRAKTIDSVLQWPYKQIAVALEVVPRTLAQNCGANVIRVVTNLRAKHAEDSPQVKTWGINGETGKMIDMKELGIWEPLAVKVQTLKTAVEAACLLLRVDDIVSAQRQKSSQGRLAKPGEGGGPMDEHGIGGDV